MKNANRARVFSSVFYFELPAGLLGTILPDGFKNQPEIFKRNLILQVRRGLIQLKKQGRHPDQRFMVCQFFESHGVAPEIGLLPTEIEDESPRGAKKGTRTLAAKK